MLKSLTVKPRAMPPKTAATEKKDKSKSNPKPKKEEIKCGKLEVGKSKIPGVSLDLKNSVEDQAVGITGDDPEIAKCNSSGVFPPDSQNTVSPTEKTVSEESVVERISSMESVVIGECHMASESIESKALQLDEKLLPKPSEEGPSTSQVKPKISMAKDTGKSSILKQFMGKPVFRKPVPVPVKPKKATISNSVKTASYCEPVSGGETTDTLSTSLEVQPMLVEDKAPETVIPCSEATEMDKIGLPDKQGETQEVVNELPSRTEEKKAKLGHLSEEEGERSKSYKRKHAQLNEDGEYLAIEANIDSDEDEEQKKKKKKAAPRKSKNPQFQPYYDREQQFRDRLAEQGQDDIDPSQLALSDLCFYTPAYIDKLKDEMKPVLENRKKLAIKQEKGKEQIAVEQDAAVGEPIAMETETVATESNSESGGLKCTIDEHGNFILDQESRYVETAESAKERLALQGQAVLHDAGNTQYNRFGKLKTKRSRVTFSEKENKKFFAALALIGPNFEKMTQFFPHLTREHLRNKFKSEDKKNPQLITQVLKKVEFDLGTYQGLLDSSADENEEEETEEKKSKKLTKKSKSEGDQAKPKKEPKPRKLKTSKSKDETRPPKIPRSKSLPAIKPVKGRGFSDYSPSGRLKKKKPATDMSMVDTINSVARSHSSFSARYDEDTLTEHCIDIDLNLTGAEDVVDTEVTEERQDLSDVNIGQKDSLSKVKSKPPRENIERFDPLVVKVEGNERQGEVEASRKNKNVVELSRKGFKSIVAEDIVDKRAEVGPAKGVYICDTVIDNILFEEWEESISKETQESFVRLRPLSPDSENFDQDTNGVLPSQEFESTGAHSVSPGNHSALVGDASEDELIVPESLHALPGAIGEELIVPESLQVRPGAIDEELIVPDDYQDHAVKARHVLDNLVNLSGKTKIRIRPTLPPSLTNFQHQLVVPQLATETHEATFRVMQQSANDVPQQASVIQGNELDVFDQQTPSNVTPVKPNEEVQNKVSLDVSRESDLQVVEPYTELLSPQPLSSKITPTKSGTEMRPQKKSSGIKRVTQPEQIPQKTETVAKTVTHLGVSKVGMVPKSGLLKSISLKPTAPKKKALKDSKKHVPKESSDEPLPGPSARPVVSDVEPFKSKHHVLDAVGSQSETVSSQNIALPSVVSTSVCSDSPQKTSVRAESEIVPEPQLVTPISIAPHDKPVVSPSNDTIKSPRLLTSVATSKKLPLFGSQIVRNLSSLKSSPVKNEPPKISSPSPKAGIEPSVGVPPKTATPPTPPTLSFGRLSYQPLLGRSKPTQLLNTKPSRITKFCDSGSSSDSDSDTPPSSNIKRPQNTPSTALLKGDSKQTPCNLDQRAEKNNSKSSEGLALHQEIKTVMAQPTKVPESISRQVPQFRASGSSLEPTSASTTTRHVLPSKIDVSSPGVKQTGKPPLNMAGGSTSGDTEIEQTCSSISSTASFCISKSSEQSTSANLLIDALVSTSSHEGLSVHDSSGKSYPGGNDSGTAFPLPLSVSALSHNASANMLASDKLAALGQLQGGSLVAVEVADPSAPSGKVFQVFYKPN